MRAGQRLWATAGPAMVVIIAMTGACTTTTPTASPATPSPSALVTTAPTVQPTSTQTAPTTPTSSTPGPIATAGSNPSPGPTSAPTSTPLASGELAVHEAAINRHLDALQGIADANGGERAAGTSGYEASVDYVEAELQQMGYQVRRDRFDFTTFREAGPVTVEVGDESWTNPSWVHAQIYSPGGEVTANVELVGTTVDGGPTESRGCDQADWAGFTRGSVALVFGGECRRRDALLLAQGAGASAMISMYGSGENEVLQPTLVNPDGLTIPSLVVGREPETALINAAQSGAAVHLDVPVEMTESSNENVIAELPGTTDTLLMLGGHLDSVLGGPGLNDNGSGVATLLALAESLAAAPQPQLTVRFGFWGAEEFGDIGSGAYVAELSGAEEAFFRAYLNLDMVGSPNAGHYFYRDSFATPRSAELGIMLENALSAQGTPGLPTDTGGASDHFSFEVNGIPTSGLFSGIAPLSDEEAQQFDGTAGVPADACYHLTCDARENVDTGTAVLLGSAMASLVEDLAY